MKTFFAKHFTNDSLSEANKILEAQNNQVRLIDALTMMYCCGASSVLWLFSIFFMAIPTQSGTADYKDLDETLAVSRLAFIVIYIIFASGLVIQILQSYDINYLYIFELDPNHKMTHF